MSLSAVWSGFTATSISTIWVLPSAKQVRYHISLSRVIERKLIMGIADGLVSVDGKEIYHAKDLKVGLFTSTSEF